MGFNFDNITSVALAIVGVALVTTVVMRPNSAKIITASGNAFSKSIRAAMGK